MPEKKRMSQPITAPYQKADFQVRKAQSPNVFLSTPNESSCAKFPVLKVPARVNRVRPIATSF
jgi:hypothetical protein